MSLSGSLRLLCAAGLIALAQPAGTGVISGTVVDSVSGDPVRKAIVTATWHGTPRSWATARTDGSGRFKFDGLPTGNYDLRANKAGIGTAIYGANSTREVGETIALADGETRGGLKLRFLHASTISGRVFDPDGDPLTDARVSLLRPGRNLGERILGNYQETQTDDRGEYRLTHIDPGQYYLYATFQVRTQADVKEIIVGQYYGGARDQKDSTALTLHGGESLTEIDFRLTREPALQIHGRVTGVPEPDVGSDPAPPPRRGRIVGLQSPPRLTVVEVSGVPVEANRGDRATGGAAGPPEYQFNLGQAPPGQYRIEATIRGDKTYAASQIVDAQPGMGEIVLALEPAADVKGQLRIEGQNAPELKSLQITLNRANSNVLMGRENHSAKPAGDGHFTLAQVTPGEWELNVNPMPRGAFLKSATLGDKDVRFKRIEVESGTDDALNVVISMHSAKIQGEVDPANGDPRRAGILLAPTGPFHDLARFYYAVAADDDGKFKMIGIAPGKYKIFALEKLAAMNFRSPEAADQLSALIEGGAQEIELGGDASLEVHPKLIPMERAKEILP